MQAGRANPPLFISRMGQMEAHANLDELHLLGQAEVQRLEEEVVEAYEVQEEEDSKKLSEMSESPGTASEDDGPEENVSTPS